MQNTNSSYKNIITKHTNMLNNKESDARTCWELCKKEIKEKSISFGISKAKSIKSHISCLEKELKEKNRTKRGPRRNTKH